MITISESLAIGLPGAVGERGTPLVYMFGMSVSWGMRFRLSVGLKLGVVSSVCAIVLS